MTTGQVSSSFAALLKRHRLGRGLSQEALAERAGISVRAVSDLERGLNRAPRKDTLALLVAALRLSPEEQDALEAAASRVRAPAVAAPTVEAGPARANLPLALTSFIGREQELAEVTRLLAATRLLTLTGTGGVGKTRLALQVAAGLLEQYPEGVWLAELAPLADPTGVAVAVASAVGIREEAGQPLLATLVAALRPRRLLLVLDNCEHLLDACAALAEALLRACPRVTILATGREALGIAGETAWRVPSLALPDPQHLPPPEVLAQVEAVHLFVERAVAVQPHFAVMAQNAPIVVQICQRLDGIPLALELAAGRLRGLSLEHLADRLDRRFRLLTGGSRTALPRQQTLQATVDWSYTLLSAPEQALFNRLAVFSGGFSLEAAEAVCSGGQIAPEDVLDLLLRLVDRSLVTVEEREGDIERYRLLETLRQYGRERLLAEGKAEALHALHAAYFRTLAEQSRPGLLGQRVATWLDRLEAENVNIRQALRWAIDTRATQDGLRLAGALTGFWYTRGYWGEGHQWASEMLALPGAAERTIARARALTCLVVMDRGARLRVGSQVAGAGTIALASEAVSIAREREDRPLLAQTLFQLGALLGRQDYPAGCALLEECLALYHELDHAAGEGGVFNTLGDLAWEQGDKAAARSWWSHGLELARQSGFPDAGAAHLGDLGMMAYHEGDYAAARSQIAESLVLYRTVHSRMGISVSLSSLGAVARAQEDMALARACGEEKLSLWQEVGDRAGIAATLAELGAVAQQEGDFARAESLFQQALTLRQDLRNTVDIAASLAHLGGLAFAQGNFGRAATLYTEGLELLRTAGNRAVVAMCLGGLASVARASGHPERAARLYGAGASLHRGTFVLNVWDDRAARDRQVTALRLALGDDAFTAAWAEGQAMTLEQAIAEAMESGEAS